MTQTAHATEWLRIPVDALRRLPALCGEGASSMEAALQLRQFGYALGPSFSDAFLESVGSADAAAETPDAVGSDEYWQSLSRFFAGLGWGTLEFRQLHPGVAALDAYAWADPDGHLSTGILAEMLSRVAGSEVAVMETAARDTSSECTCRFVFGGADTLQALYQQLRGSASLAEAVEQLG